MKRSSVPTVVLVTSALLVALLVYGVVQQQSGVGSDAIDTKVASGERPPAPQQELARPLLSGDGERKLADLAGKVVVVNFFASWCGPCKTEAPVLERTQAALAKDDAGTVLGVTYNDAPDAALAFAKENGLAFPLVKDPENTLFESFGNRGIPETFVLDGKGQIVALRRGEVDQSFLDDAVAKAKAAA